MKLNLGCADRKLDGYIGVDICPPADQIVDLEKPWPWPDSSVDEVVAFDVIEHLNDKIFTMNELWRVLKPGARALIEVPSSSHGAGADQDPTHRSRWNMNSFQYYAVSPPDGPFARNRLGESYGIRAQFKVLHMEEKEYQDVREKVWKITAALEAVK